MQAVQALLQLDEVLLVDEALDDLLAARIDLALAMHERLDQPLLGEQPRHRIQVLLGRRGPRNVVGAAGHGPPL